MLMKDFSLLWKLSHDKFSLITKWLYHYTYRNNSGNDKAVALITTHLMTLLVPTDMNSMVQLKNTRAALDQHNTCLQAHMYMQD